MSHQAQIEFCKRVKKAFPKYFKGVFVLDAGSLDINGNNRYLFSNSTYIGVDVCAGNNVDIIKTVHELDYPDGYFDTIISTEMLEHDRFYEKTIIAIIRMLAAGGLLLFTCATTGRRIHGTKNNHPEDSPTNSIEGWENYYKNLTEKDFRKIINLDKVFEQYNFGVEHNHHDLYFWGIKR